MSLRRSRKIAPESPIAIEEGFTHEGERESGEGCSRESINDDHAPLVDPQWHANRRKPSSQSSALEQQDEARPESRMGKRFVRYRNSWIGEDSDSVALNVESLRRIHARLNARSRIIEEADEGILP